MTYDNVVRHVIRLPMKKSFITISEATELTGLSYRTIQRYIAMDIVSSIKGDNGVRQIDKSTLLNATTSKNKLAQAAAFEADIQTLLLELIELIPNSTVETLSRKASIRARIKQLMR